MANERDQVSPATIEAAIAEMEPAQVLRAIEHLPPWERQNAILASPQAERVVSLMPLEDLYLLVKEIGEEDALPLLELAATTQVEGLLDLEIWRKDRLEPRRTAKWFGLLMELEDERFLRHLVGLDRALVIAFFKQYFRVHKRDETYDPIQSDRIMFVTPDERYYIENLKKPEACALPYQILMRVYRLDFALFRELLEGIYWELLSHCEELAYQDKVRRLADHGFPDYFSSLDILQVRGPGQVQLRRREYRAVPTFDLDTPAPAYPTRVGSPDSLLHRAVARLDGQAAYDVRWDLAFVANRFLVARQVDFGEVRRVRVSIERVHDYVNVALEKACGDNVESAADLLARYHVRELFIAGHSNVQILRRRARRLAQEMKDTWGLSGELLLEYPYRDFLEELTEGDEPRLFLGVVQKGSTGARPFSRYLDVRRARHLLARLELLADVFARFLPSEPWQGILAGTNLGGNDELRLAPLFTAGTAHFLLHGEFRLAPLPAADLDPFLREAFIQDGQRYRLGTRLVQALDASLAHLATEMGDAAIRQIRPFFEEFLDATAEELGEAAAHPPIQPQFLRTILVTMEA